MTYLHLSGRVTYLKCRLTDLRSVAAALKAKQPRYAQSAADELYRVCGLIEKEVAAKLDYLLELTKGGQDA